MIIFLYMAI